jgi:peptidoglycan/xylan/chitin deacetylase (PgdA/CDA1 family)
MTVSQEMFDQQMRLLKEKGYRVISLDQFFDFLEFKAPLLPKSVVITIDDGWRSMYEIAFPILKKYGYPATLFIYTDMITGTSKTLSWDLLQEMAGYGIDIQCHTKSHRNLTLPAKKEPFKNYFANLEKELAVCKGMIKKKLNQEVKYLAYPYGDTTSLVIELAKKLGYRGAFTIQRGGNPFFIHNYRVNRSGVYGDFPLSQFEKNLTIFQEQTLR